MSPSGKAKRSDRRLGQTLDDRYEIENLIGRGGMGLIYLARDIARGHHVVIKMLSSHWDDDDEAVERFKREGDRLGELTHPNIVELIDVGTHEDHGYIVMEYIDGEPLRRCIARQRRLTIEEFVPIAHQVLAAVGHIHTEGVMMRDIKPSNVMLCERGGLTNYVKLLDFGLARLVDGGEREVTTAHVVGTAGYLAPELITGDPCDVRVDVYAIGILFFVMLTGQSPIIGENDGAVLYNHVHGTPIRLEALLPDGHAVPDTLIALINQCMEKEPNRRPSDANSVAEALFECVPPEMLSLPPATEETRAAIREYRVAKLRIDVLKDPNEPLDEVDGRLPSASSAEWTRPHPRKPKKEPNKEQDLNSPGVSPATEQAADAPAPAPASKAASGAADEIRKRIPAPTEARRRDASKPPLGRLPRREPTRQGLPEVPRPASSSSSSSFRRPPPARTRPPAPAGMPKPRRLTKSMRIVLDDSGPPRATASSTQMMGSSALSDEPGTPSDEVELIPSNELVEIEPGAPQEPMLFGLARGKKPKQEPGAPLSPLEIAPSPGEATEPTSPADFPPPRQQTLPGAPLASVDDESVEIRTGFDLRVAIIVAAAACALLLGGFAAYKFLGGEDPPEIASASAGSGAEDAPPPAVAEEPTQIATPSPADEAEAEAAPAEPDASIGTIEVTSIEGAIVYIDDQERGAAPTESGLSVGRHRVRVVADGYEPWEQDVEVAAGENPALHAELVAIAASATPRVRRPRRQTAPPESTPTPTPFSDEPPPPKASTPNPPEPKPTPEPKPKTKPADDVFMSKGGKPKSDDAVFLPVGKSNK